MKTALFDPLKIPFENGKGTNTSRCSGKKPVLADRTQEIGGNRA